MVKKQQRGRKKLVNLNKTTYTTDKKGLSHSKERDDSQSIKHHEGTEKSKEEVDDALPVIKDEDFEKYSKEDQLVPEANKNAEKEVKSVEPHSLRTSSDKHHRGNTLYKIHRRRRTGQHPYMPQARLHSHQARTKVRIQGKHGVKSEHYVNLQKSIHEQEKQEDKKRYIIKARERHKIQEKIEKYRYA